MTAKRRVRMRVRVVVAFVAAVLLLGGVWLWLRDSSLVAVQRVSITGVSGPNADQIRAVLTRAARNMTTLDVRVGQLRLAVAPYPVVKDVQVSTRFPHGLRIRVVEQLPVAALEAGGRSIAAAGDGTVLHDVSTASLPVIAVPVLPGGSRVNERPALDALALLSVSPPRLLSRMAQVTNDPSHGLVVQLRSGPSLYFGDGSDLAAKWVAATDVLADPSSAGATYIDVTDPARPAAGVSPQAVAAAGLATSGSQASGSQTVGSAPTTSGSASAVQPSTTGG
jgi:cell division protein FtsQ